MLEHPTTWVKVNAPVDEGIAEIVSLLSEVEGLQTLESCQGRLPVDSPEGIPAYVFFHFGDWETISRFAFEVVAPALGELEADIAVTVEIFNHCDPIGKVRIRSPNAIPAVAAESDPISLDTELA